MAFKTREEEELKATKLAGVRIEPVRTNLTAEVRSQSVAAYTALNAAIEALSNNPTIKKRLGEPNSVLGRLV